MAANTGANAAFPSRPYPARQQNTYNQGAYHTGTPFQLAQQTQPAYNATSQAQHARNPAPGERDFLGEMTDEQREEINEAFALFDLDKDNYIDYHETKVAFKALGFELAKNELLQILQTNGIPANSPGGKAPATNQVATFTGPSKLLLSHAAFQAEAARRIFGRDPQEEISRAFALFDQDGKGRIDLEDLRRVAHELGEGLQEEELRAMIEEFDIRGEGGISQEEFLGICLG